MNFYMKKEGTEPCNLLFILAGLILCTVGDNMFLIPNRIAAGGFTGASQVLNVLTKWPVGRILFCLNVPLFLLSFKSLGLKFGVRSLITTILLSVMIDYIPLPSAVEDLPLSVLFGGAMTGAGYGLILRGNATTGGTDLLASIVHRYLPRVPISVLISLFDGVVILASVFVFDTTLALYGLVTMFVCNFVIGILLEGPNSAYAFFIISDKEEEIASAVANELERGGTVLSGKGMYSGQEKRVLLCAVSKKEILHLRQIVYREDPHAFIISTRAKGTFGLGFRPLR